MIADTINYAVSYADCKQNNEVPEFQFLRIELPKNTQGLSPLSSDSLYLRTQTSIPCAKLAKSLFSTFSFRYSYISGGNVTVNEILLRAMHLNRLHKILNMCNLNMCIASDKGAGSSKNESNKPISERAERNGWKFTIIQHCGSGRKIRQYPMQDIVGVLSDDRGFCEGRHREQNVGSYARDLQYVLNSGDLMNASDIFNDGLNEFLHALYITDCNADIDELCSMLECDSRDVKIGTVRLEHAKLITMYDLGRKYRLTDLGKDVAEICEHIYGLLEGAKA